MNAPTETVKVEGLSLVNGWLNVTSNATSIANNNPTFPEADAWRVTLRFCGRRMTVSYYMGSAFNGRPPTSREVLAGLLLDASCAAESFEDFCTNLGYDVDSIKALKVYKTCKGISARLHKFLGNAYTLFEQELAND
jgi:hypothetical protein